MGRVVWGVMGVRGEGGWGSVGGGGGVAGGSAGVGGAVEVQSQPIVGEVMGGVGRYYLGAVGCRMLTGPEKSRDV